ncbi:MAG: transporter substrate-binding domain-containing protein [Bacteroidales bacterium]|nr:transporter substrate-binding domain-containing protein [Bacteroidales bacterium]HBL72636.1 glutamine ABC transporter substrate-binding protein [Bacteroidales bacterium]
MTKPFKTSLILASFFVLGWLLFALLQQYTNRHEPHSDYPAIKNRGELRVCGEYDPFSFYTDDQGQHGFHYELAKAFAEAHGLTLVYMYEGTFRTRMQWLNTGRCDLLTGPLPILNSLRPTLAYTMPLYGSRLVLVQRRSDKPLRNQVNLADKTVSIASHSPYLVRISHLATEISDSIHVKEVRVFTHEELLKQVNDGKTDFAVMDEYMAKAWSKDYPELDIQTPLSLTQFQAWAVRPNSPQLLDSLNVFLEGYKKSRAYARLLKRYGATPTR